MYIQSPREDAIPLPRDYSGSTFRQEPQKSDGSEETHPVPTPVREEQEEKTPTAAQDTSAEQVAGERENTEDATPAGAFFKEDGHGAPRGGLGGLFSGASSLLSAFLPPARGSKKRKDSWSEWIVIGIALLLFLNDDADDLLPLLLLLLLWD